MSIFLVSPSIPCKRSNKQFIILKHKTFLDTPSKFFDRMGFIGWRVLNDSSLSDSLVRWPQSDNLSNDSLKTVLVVVVYILNGDDKNIILECEIPFLYSQINGYWILIQYCDQNTSLLHCRFSFNIVFTSQHIIIKTQLSSIIIVEGQMNVQGIFSTQFLHRNPKCMHKLSAWEVSCYKALFVWNKKWQTYFNSLNKNSMAVSNWSVGIQLLYSQYF